MMNRREFVKQASLAVAAIGAGNGAGAVAADDQSTRQARSGTEPYKYRIAFGAWINDMRWTPLPLENWPAPQLDDEAVDSAIAAMDLQSAAGYNMLDVWGLFATYGWPPDIISAVDKDRRKRIHKLLAAAKHRRILLTLGMGTYSWGYDKIIAADPDVRGKNPDGTPHAHAMCDANPKSFEYVKKILDFALGEFDFGGVHLESCDLGCCGCPSCAGKDGVVGYNVRISQKTADYIRGKWPGKPVYVITINWAPAGKHFNAAEKAHVIELGKHVDCIFDQGHAGYHIAEEERREFIKALLCAYGTSGKLWLYPDTKWDRTSYFLPYVQRACAALRAQHEDGVRGCMYYQGPVTNPGQEVMMAVGGRILSKPERSADEILDEVLTRYYKPRSAEAMQRLTRVFHVAEDSYFSQWSAEHFSKVWGIPVPGEFKLDQRLFGTSPGPATYLKEPCLDAKGRSEYRAGLSSILSELVKLQGQCDDQGRLANIQRGIIVTLNLLNTISYCLGETIP
jgi:hypothetical protein